MVHMVQWFMGVHQKPSPMVSSRSCRSHPGQLEQTGTRVSQGPGFIDAHLQPGVTAWGNWSLLGLLEPAGTRRTSVWVPGSPYRDQCHGTCLWAGLLRFQFSSVAHSCPTVCDPMDCSMLPCPSPTPRVYSNSCPSSWWCHPTTPPLWSPSPPAFNLSQDQGLFQWVSSPHQVAKVLEFKL